MNLLVERVSKIVKNSEIKSTSITFFSGIHWNQNLENEILFVLMFSVIFLYMHGYAMGKISCFVDNLNSLLNNEILHWYNLKALADDKLNVAKMMISVFDRKHCGKKEKMLNCILGLNLDSECNTVRNSITLN